MAQKKLMSLAEAAKMATLRRKCDRLAVKIVSIMNDYHGGKLPAYAGIEAAREIQRLLIQKFK